MLQTPMDTRDWKRYHAVRDAFRNGNVSKADLNLERLNLMDKDGGGSKARAFTPYWILLSLKKEYPEKVTDEKVEETLLKCKKEGSHIRERYEYFKQRPDIYKGHELKWEVYMPYDERYNFYDRRTYKAVLPWRFTDEEKKDFQERFYQPYVLSEDGRDCSCSWKQWASIYRCKDRTVIHLNRTCDC